MRTKTQVINESNIPTRLINGVIKQLGGMSEAKTSMPDIVNHGISGGFHGFIYYSDTVSFYKKYRAEIVELAEQMADDLGEDVLTMISNFGCLRGYMDRDGKQELTRTLYGRMKSDDTQIANALAWFAGEEVSRAFCDY